MAAHVISVALLPGTASERLGWAAPLAGVLDASPRQLYLACRFGRISTKRTEPGVEPMTLSFKLCLSVQPAMANLLQRSQAQGAVTRASATQTERGLLFP